MKLEQDVNQRNNLHLHATAGIVIGSTLRQQSLLKFVALHVHNLLALFEVAEHVQAIAVIVSCDGAIDHWNDSIDAGILSGQPVLWQLHRVTTSLCPKRLLDFRPNVTGDFGGVVAAIARLCT
jgi:hypothetical protein